MRLLLATIVAIAGLAVMHWTNRDRWSGSQEADYHESHPDDALEVARQAQALVGTDPLEAERQFYFALTLDRDCQEALEGLRRMGAV